MKCQIISDLEVDSLQGKLSQFATILDADEIRTGM